MSICWRWYLQWILNVKSNIYEHFGHCVLTSITRLDYFCKVLVTRFLRKCPKHLTTFVLFCETWLFKKKFFVYVLGNLRKKLGYFLFQHLVTLVVAQWAEWLLAAQEVHISNPVIIKICIEPLFYVNCIVRNRPGICSTKIIDCKFV